jgi:hypothetical protein
MPSHDRVAVALADRVVANPPERHGDARFGGGRVGKITTLSTRDPEAGFRTWYPTMAVTSAVLPRLPI